MYSYLSRGAKKKVMIRKETAIIKSILYTNAAVIMVSNMCERSSSERLFSPYGGITAVSTKSKLKWVGRFGGGGRVRTFLCEFVG